MDDIWLGSSFQRQWMSFRRTCYWIALILFVLSLLLFVGLGKASSSPPVGFASIDTTDRIARALLLTLIACMFFAMLAKSGMLGRGFIFFFELLYFLFIGTAYSGFREATIRTHVHSESRRIRQVEDHLIRTTRGESSAFPAHLAQVSLSSDLPNFSLDRFHPEKKSFGYMPHDNGFILFSLGPNQRQDLRLYDVSWIPDRELERRVTTSRYDPTNGTISGGDIIIWHREPPAEVQTVATQP